MKASTCAMLESVFATAKKDLTNAKRTPIGVLHFCGSSDEGVKRNNPVNCLQSKVDIDYQNQNIKIIDFSKQKGAGILCVFQALG